MSDKRFGTNGYYIYDFFQNEERWLINAEAKDIVSIMNNLDTKARERSKALSTLQKKFNELKDENERLKKENDMLKHMIGRNESYVVKLTHKGEWR